MNTQLLYTVFSRERPGLRSGLRSHSWSDQVVTAISTHSLALLILTMMLMTILVLMGMLMILMPMTMLVMVMYILAEVC